MRARRERSILILSLAASVAVHLAAAALLATRPGESPRHAALAFDAPLAEAVEHEEDHDRPGIDASQATSITWIGFDEYREHLAEASTIDQPELAVEPAAEEPPGSLDGMMEASLVQGAGEALDASGGAAPAADAMEPPVQPMQSPLVSAVDTQAPEAGIMGPPAPSQSEVHASQGGSVPYPEGAQASRSVMAGPAPEPGVESDRESQASSVLTAAWKKLGQPIAGEGIEVFTRKPRFTKYTSIVGAMRDPIVRVHFRRDGRVDKVELVRSSGNPDVDRPVLDALYQWRAVGKRLESLPSESSRSIAMDFRILM